jgi:hypothetical protein
MNDGPLINTAAAGCHRLPQDGRFRVVPILTTARGEVLTPDLVEARAGSVKVMFSRGEPPSFPLGADQHLKLDRPGTNLSLARPVMVVGRQERPGGRIYVLKLKQSAEEQAETASMLTRLFNLRETVRVVPEPGRPVAAKLFVPGKTWEILSRVEDLSAGGLGVVVDPEWERVLSKLTTIHLDLRLPDVEERLIFDARIAARALQAGGIRYHLAFNHEDSADLERKIDTVVDYVMGHQQRRLQGKPA